MKFPTKQIVRIIKQQNARLVISTTELGFPDSNYESVQKASRTRQNDRELKRKLEKCTAYYGTKI